VLKIGVGYCVQNIVAAAHRVTTVVVRVAQKYANVGELQLLCFADVSYNLQVMNI
jgi:hypothetical protein